jgi:hypothetical protein
MRMFLCCEACGGRLVLYRIDNDWRAHPRGREESLESFLQAHAGCGTPPPLEVVTDGELPVVDYAGGMVLVDEEPGEAEPAQ